MKAAFFLSAFLAAMAVTTRAQTSKAVYQGLVQAGLLEGERGSALQLQMVQGVKYKTWSAGIGAGLDYYHTRSIPLFLDVRKAFSQKDKGAFVYADGGYHFVWLTAADKQSFLTDTKGGFYYDAGIGYEFPVMKKNRFFFSAGISGKEFTTSEETWFYIDYIWPGPSSQLPANVINQYHYRLQRLSIKAGLRF